MSDQDLEWRPGSFSKNFSWGRADGGDGLAQLQRAIAVGFEGRVRPASRDTFRQRVRALQLPDLIPANFFLFNFIEDGINHLAVDELVLQALTLPHSPIFDRLAVFALNLSIAGVWQGARPFQRYPALWAKHYITEVVHADGVWRPDLINADSIESFFLTRMQFESDRPRKFATNLNDIYRRANIASLRSGLKEAWWGHAVFLALDRILMDQGVVELPSEAQLLDRLDGVGFWQLTAVPKDEGHVAVAELLTLYRDVGGPARFDLNEIEAAASTIGGSKNQKPAILAATQSATDMLPVARIFVQAQRQSRNRQHVLFVKQIYDHRCAICDRALLLGDRRQYSEAGHVRPVGKPFDGPDHSSNMLVFCPNHHKSFDHGALTLVSEGGANFRVNSLVGDAEVHNRSFVAEISHGLNPDFVDWHADYYSNR